MNKLFNSVKEFTFKNVFSIGLNENSAEKDLVARWEQVQEDRRMKRWKYSFKSVEGGEFNFNTASSSTGMPSNIDSEIDTLMERVNDENYVSFINELKSLYLKVRDPKHDDLVKDMMKELYTENMENNFIEATESFSNAFECSEKRESSISFEIKTKILLNEPLNEEELIALDSIYRKVVVDGVSELTALEKLSVINFSVQDVDLNLKKKQIVRRFAECILNKYVGIEKNVHMDNDVFHEALGVYWKVEELNALIRQFPNNKYVQLGKAYLEIKSGDILAIINDEIGFEILNEENTEDIEEIKNILFNLSFFTVIFNQIRCTVEEKQPFLRIPGEESRKFVMRTLDQINERELEDALEEFGIKDLETTECYNKIKDVVYASYATEREILVENISESIKSKFNGLYVTISNKNQEFNINLSSITEFQKSLNAEVVALSKITGPEEFYEKYTALLVVARCLSDIDNKISRIRDNITVDGIPCISDIENDPNLKSVKIAFENLKFTLEKNSMYRDGAKSFLEAVLDFIKSLFEKKSVYIVPSARMELTRSSQRGTVSISQ